MKEPDFTLTPEILLNAYANGVFPMAESRDSDEIFWLDPRRRGVLPLNGFHISRSLARRLRRGGYEVALNRDFAGVVAACAARDETWINHEIIDLYQALHDMGFAHSLEIYDDGELTGGAYGVAMGGAFFGESMFSRRVDASKLALAHLTDHLRTCGFTLCDTQFLTDHLASLGAIEISRAAYRAQLEDALKIEASFTAQAICSDGHSVVQRNTQTS